MHKKRTVQFPLMLTREEQQEMRKLRANAVNVSQFLRLCLKKKLAQMEEENDRLI